jgi:hypothetical protein
MRVAVIVVSMLVVVTPSQASTSCMSKTEARQHFGAVHIYWHGADHCWDASPTSQRYQIRVQRKNPIHEVQQKRDQPKWHDSMSRMLADDEPEGSASFNAGHRENDDAAAGTPWINRWVDIGPSNRPLDARWVEIPQDMPLSVIQRKPEPMISPHVILLVFITITIALTLATIEFIFRRTASG